MKKNIMVILFLSLNLFAFAQNNMSNRDYFLKKSKNQKTAFYVLAGTGAALLITGLAYGASHNDPNKDNYSYTGGFIALGGITLGAISVPFITGSSKNKKRAMTFSVRNEMIKGMYKNIFIHKAVPEIQLSVGL